jgi:PAS domain S-box-containing protein
MQIFEENYAQSLAPTAPVPVETQDAVQGVLDEMAERKRDLLFSVLDAMPVALCMKDSDARRIFANAADLAMLGQPDLAAALGKNDLELLPDRLGETSYREDIEVLRTGQPVLRCEREQIGRAGESRHVLLTKLPLRDDAQKIIGLAEMVEDITEFKAIQAEFWQQQKMKSFAAMSSSVAHDFSNLLTPIIGLSEVLLFDAVSGSRQQQFLDKILASAYKAKTLLKQLRMFSHLHETQKLPVDLVATVKEVCDAQKTSLPPTVTLHTTYSVSSVVIQADAAHIFQMVSNLLTNALESIDSEGGKIVVAIDRVADVGEQAEPRQWLRLKISDTGQGMDEMALREIFEPFAGTRRSIGSGLGLAIVRGVVQNLGGTISVESEPGHGSTFTILLPPPETPSQ